MCNEYRHDCVDCRALLKAEFAALELPTIDMPKCELCNHKVAQVRIQHACGAQFNVLSCLTCWTVHQINIEMATVEQGAEPLCGYCGEPATLGEHIKAVKINRRNWKVGK